MTKYTIILADKITNKKGEIINDIIFTDTIEKKDYGIDTIRTLQSGKIQNLSIPWIAIKYIIENQ